MKDMKIMFVEARKTVSPEDRENIKKAAAEFSRKQPKIKKLGLLASVQYLDFLQEFRKNLEKQGKKVFLARGRLARYPGQILGCDVLAGKRLEKEIDAFLAISSGKFHVLHLGLMAKKPVFLWQGKEIFQQSQGEIEKLRGRRKAAIARFLSAREIGIIASTKHGQENLKLAKKLQNKLEKQGRKAFLFIADTINIYELENFTCQSWLNTACPGMILDSGKIVNYSEVREFLG